MLALISFDGLIVACSCLLNLNVKVILWVILYNALEAKD